MFTKEDIQNFIRAYENLPELWDVKSEKYNVRIHRDKAFEKLLVEYRKIRPDSTMNEMRNKMINMRTSYRRELRKVIETEHLDESRRYIPTLWYFDNMDFLRNVEIPKKYKYPLPDICKIRNIDDVAKLLKRPSLNVYDTSRNTDGRPTLDSLLELYPLPKKSKQSPARTELSDPADTEHHDDTVESDTHEVEVPVSTKAKVGQEHAAVRKNLTGDDEDDEDDAAVFANAWGCMFRDMSPDQQLYAKQAVDEIMLLGRLNKLSLNYLYKSESDTALTQMFLPEDGDYTARVSDEC